MVQLYVILPVDGGGGSIDNTLPGGRPPHIGGGPIYHPGHPDHGLPSGGHIDNSLPNIPGLPGNELPPGQPVTINPPPPPPAGHENELVVAVWNNGAWTITAYDTDVSAGHPLPETPQPKGRHR